MACLSGKGRSSSLSSVRFHFTGDLLVGTALLRSQMAQKAGSLEPPGEGAFFVWSVVTA